MFPPPLAACSLSEVCSNLTHLEWPFKGLNRAVKDSPKLAQYLVPERALPRAQRRSALACLPVSTVGPVPVPA
jgi:hypothetical protein